MEGDPGADAATDDEHAVMQPHGSVNVGRGCCVGAGAGGNTCLLPKRPPKTPLALAAPTAQWFAHCSWHCFTSNPMSAVWQRCAQAVEHLAVAAAAEGTAEGAALGSAVGRPTWRGNRVSMTGRVEVGRDTGRV